MSDGNCPRPRPVVETYDARMLRVFTPEQIEAIEEQIRRVIMSGCGYGRVELVFANWRLVDQNCAEERRVKA